MKESDKRKRVNCPLDPKHTVFQDKLEQHLKKCNVTLKTKLPFYSENINLNIKDYFQPDDEKVPLYLVPADVLRVLIDKIKKCYTTCCNTEITENLSRHEALDEELNKSTNGPAVKKHLMQQASILSILEQSKSLEDGRTFIEFGAGRGALSHWIQKAMEGKNETKFLLVDRQHNR